MKRVLIISPHWPPLNAPDMQRARMSLPYYRAAGWEPVVLAVADDQVDGVREPELAATIPADIAVHRCGALPLRPTRRMGLNNIGLRAWPYMFAAGSRLIKDRRVDLVFFTNTQFVTFTLGRIWRARHGTPYVFDMQDPWRTDYYQRPGSRRPPGGWKYQLARFMAWGLEGWSLRRASGVISVSPHYIEQFLTRYSWFKGTPAAVIRFGASEADLAAAARLDAPAYRIAKKPGELHVVYTGAAGPIVPHATRALFRALANYRVTKPDLARRLRFHFLGTSYAAPGTGRNEVMPIAQECGVDDQVTEVPHRLGHLEAIRVQLDADLLLLPGSSDPAYSPSKLFPYCLSGRPILALVFKGSVLERQLDELGCATVVRMTAEGPDETAAAELAVFFDRALAGDMAAGVVRNDALLQREYLAESLTRRQCELFDRAVDFAHG